MMKIYRSLLLLTLPFHFYLTSNSQVSYNPQVDSLVQEVHFDSLMLLNRQLSGDTSVVIGGVTDTIASRAYSDPGNVLAAQFIMERFQSFGLDVHMMNYDPDGQNVIATKTGSLYPDQQYIICAHYDSRPYASFSPGADDNASGVCAVLEAARLAGNTDFPYTLKFIAFDEEESGLIGSKAYVDSAYANGDQILGVMNLDMLAWDSDQDNQLSISSDVASMPLLRDHMACMRIYRPELSPHMIYIGASDHYRFWNRSYKALLTIEDRQDFNPYYHTTGDHFDHISKDYYHLLTQTSLATFFTWATGSKINLHHQAITSEARPEIKTARLQVDTSSGVCPDVQTARIYYRVNGGSFQYSNMTGQVLDTLLFHIPAFPYGSCVEYYFAIQDSSGSFVTTLPDAGRGVDPPGTLSPPRLYRYDVLKDTTSSYCAAGLPLGIPPQDTVMKEITVSGSGRLLDVDVLMSIQHTSTWDLDIFLVSPSGQEVELSSRNGYNYDHYTSTRFDDEADSYIHENRAPFTGSFIPESPLAMLDDQNISGAWYLKIVNRGGISGQLTNFCMELTYSHSDIYVDGAVQSSGDGLSWATALKTFSEACQLALQPGQTVFVRPGTYNETAVIISNGEETVPLATGVEVLDTNVVQFPAGTDLSGIDLDSHPGEYMAYVYGSKLRNSGFYTVLDKDDVNDRITLADAIFLPETGETGDTSKLSCAVGRPVYYKKHCGDPDNERVVLDASNLSAANSVLYIGDSIDDGSLDALPASFNIIQGIDLTGADGGSGMHLQSSSFNIIRDSKIYENTGPGIHIAGNDLRNANHNFIYKNEIYNTPISGICIGNEEQPTNYNRARYNYLMNNEIYTAGGAQNSDMETAIQVWDHNEGNVISDHFIHDIVLNNTGASAIKIHPDTYGTLVFGNTFRDIAGTVSGMNSVIELKGNNTGVEIFNNILYNTSLIDDDLYAFRLDGSETNGCLVAHNTVYMLDRGFLLEDYNTVPDIHIQNNILELADICYTHIGYEGRFLISNNLYTADPAPDSTMAYYYEEGRQVGEVEFIDAEMGDFHLCAQSFLAICRGADISSLISIDPDRNLRDQEDPDIGAYELDDKFVWEGAVNSVWTDPSNWRSQQVPCPESNVVIEAGNYHPVLPAGQVTLNGLILLPETELHLSPATQLIITGE